MKPFHSQFATNRLGLSCLSLLFPYAVCASDLRVDPNSGDDKHDGALRPVFNLSDSRDCVFENVRAIDCGDDGISAHGECRYRVDGFISIGNATGIATGICNTGDSETTYHRVLIRDCIGFDLFFRDTGKYSISDSVVISSAAKAVYLQGHDKPAEPCRLTLDNVLIRRERTENESEPSRLLNSTACFDIVSVH